MPRCNIRPFPQHGILTSRRCILLLSLVMTCVWGCASKQTPELTASLQPAASASSAPAARSSGGEVSETAALSADPDTVQADDMSDEDYDDEYAEYDDEYDDGYEDDSPTALIADPLEPFNRAMFTVNDKLYVWVLKPTASLYAALFPHQFRRGIRNVFYNLAFPVRFVSSLLQLKLEKAATEVGSFAVNTTLGIGGLVRVSDHIEPLKNISPEDLGQTLAHYGVGDGFYIVWPLFGPSTLRDTSGQVGDYFLNPVNYIDDWELRWGIKAGETLNYTSLHLGDYDDLKEAAFDPYEALKDFYIQHRRHLVRE